MKRHPLSAQLRQTARAIVASYQASQDPAQHIDADRKRPSRTAVVRILERVFAVLYPGYYGVQHLTQENVEYHVGTLLDDVVADLYEQVLLAFQLEDLTVAQPDRDQAAARAEGAVEWFLARIPELRRILVLDLKAAMEGDPAARSYSEIVFAYPGFEAITVQRIAHELWELQVPLLPRIMTEVAQIIIGTPGRVMDHMYRRTLSMGKVKMIILDEADEMLDMGFREDIEFVLGKMPSERQMLLFSATMSKAILALTKKYQNDPLFLKVAHQELTVPQIEQVYFEVREKNKLDLLSRLIDLHDLQLSLVFCNTKRRVDKLVNHLQTRGYMAGGLHGDMSQNQRDRVMAKFRKGQSGGPPGASIPAKTSQRLS